MRRIRIRWSEAEAPDPSVRLPWQYPAAILAALFLNYSFVERYALELNQFGPYWIDAAVQGFCAIVVTSMFFLAPAMAVHAGKAPVFRVVAGSLGSVPTLLLRGIAVTFAAVWLADSLQLPLWALWRVIKDLPFRPEAGVVAVGILAFVFLTGLQGPAGSAGLARFSVRLGLALLVAALIRAHDGWEAIPGGFPPSQRDSFSKLLHGVSLIASYAGPLGFLACDLGRLSATRRPVVLTAAAGAALPLFFALLLGNAAGIATAYSRIYQPSLNSTIGMSLFAKAAGSAIAPRKLIAAISTFGALRFGAAALDGAAGMRGLGRRGRWLAMTGAIAGIAWLSMAQIGIRYHQLLAAPATCLGVASAVLAADLTSRTISNRAAKRVDCVGVTAMIAGLVTPFLLPPPYVWGQENWVRPWMLPSYATAFAVCLLGRYLGRRSHQAVAALAE